MFHAQINKVQFTNSDSCLNQTRSVYEFVHIRFPKGSFTQNVFLRLKMGNRGENARSRAFLEVELLTFFFLEQLHEMLQNTL